MEALRGELTASRKLIDPEHGQLSIVRQCALVSISRRENHRMMLDRYWKTQRINQQTV